MPAKAYLKLDDDRAGGATQIDLKPLIMSFAAVAWPFGLLYVRRKLGFLMRNLECGGEDWGYEVKAMNARSNSKRSINGVTRAIRSGATTV